MYSQLSSDRLRTSKQFLFLLKMKSFLLSLTVFCFTSIASIAQVIMHTISGSATDARSGEALINAVIMTTDGKYGTVSNTYGYFSLTTGRKR